MAEPHTLRSSIDTRSAISPFKLVSRAVLRCHTQDMEHTSERLGIELPREACTSTQGRMMSALWLGPDEWLLIGNHLADDWASRLSAQLTDLNCALVDVSHRQVAFSIEGPRAEAILATGCALDLWAPDFPIGMCTRTMFAKSEIVLWRTGLERFHLEVWRSFAGYVEALLREAESEA